MPDLGDRWLTNSGMRRITGLSDEELRQLCKKGIFRSARRNDAGDWEVLESDLRAQQILKPATVIARSVTKGREDGPTEGDLTTFFGQLVRLRKLSPSDDGKMSVNQEEYFNIVARRMDAAAAPVFRDPQGGEGVSEPVRVELQGATQVDGPPGAPPTENVERIVSRASARSDSKRAFWLYMTSGDLDCLRDEIFAGEFAPEFISPVGTRYFVCLGPGWYEGRPITWVRSYAHWRIARGGKRLERVGQCDDYFVDGLFARGSIPPQGAAASTKFLQRRDAWRVRAMVARDSLRRRLGAEAPDSLSRFAEIPRVKAVLNHYREEGLNPSELPASVRRDLASTAFFPPIGVFRLECTGEVWRNDHPNPYELTGVHTWCRRTAGWDDALHGVLEQEVNERFWLVPGTHPAGHEPIAFREGNAEYAAYKAAWERFVDQP